jgi:hypothetical protein
MPDHTLSEPIRLTSEITLEELLAAEQTQQRITQRPQQLRMQLINVADQVFQWRQLDLNLAEDERHSRELARVLTDRKQPLDPILVTLVGNRAFVVDGHHRLDAYRAAEWKRSIPVEYFEGTVEEAREEALRRNIENKLPMTRDDKFEAAWRLLKGDSKRTQAAIIELTTVSRRTISTMAAIWREHRERCIDLPWRRAKQFQ